MGRGCRGQAPPRCSRASAAHQEPSCSATGRCGRTPSSHHSRSGLFGDTKRSLSGMWPGWGRPSFEGHPSLPASPSPVHPRRKEMGCAKQWPRGHCHSWVPRHDLAAGPLGGGCGGVTRGSGGEERWGFLLSSLPGGVPTWEERTSSRSPNPAHPISRERVEGGRQQDQQEECRSCH